MRYAVDRFARYDGFGDVFATYVPLPDGVTAAQALSCFSCFVRELGPDFVREAFVDALDREVFAPLRDAQALILSQPVSTRFYTTLSPDEMTVDPEFDLNPDLPLLSNAHTAQRVVECRGDVTFAEARWRVELSDGRVVRGDNVSGWPLGSDIPVARVVEQASVSGTPEVVLDQSATIDAAIETSNEDYPRRKSGRGCAASDGRGSAGSRCSRSSASRFVRGADAADQGRDVAAPGASASGASTPSQRRGSSRLSVSSPKRVSVTSSRVRRKRRACATMRTSWSGSKRGVSPAS
ncbi:MAG: hypothetical protein H6723_03705 [Sandaracinus sp.]|nr:hypothetical protein [Sandaracinus sp.]